MNEHMPQELKKEWDDSFNRAQDTESRTLTRTMEVSAGDSAAIEEYLKAQGDLITPEEKHFLEMSLEAKRATYATQEKISSLKEEIAASDSPETEIPAETAESGVTSLEETVAALKRGMDLLNIDPKTGIKIDTEQSDGWRTVYSFTDKSASKQTLFGWFGFGRSKEKRAFYQMLGKTATEHGIDLTEGKTVNELIASLERAA